MPQTRESFSSVRARKLGARTAKKSRDRRPDYGSTRSQANCWQIVNSTQASQAGGSKHI